MALGPALWLGPLLLASLGGSSAPASLLRRLGEHLRRFQESSVLGLSPDPGVAARPREGWLEQPLDPFNASDRRTFLQRYWISDQHWASRDGPVFLNLGGEGSLGPGSVMRGHPAALAPALGALVIGLEHRFYGLSIPAGGLNMAQLRFLSSRHALADVVSARLALSRLHNVSSSSRWVCFGGSYAGSLAAWARLKFPHLLFAAVASSAPVRAVLDFSAYNEEPHEHGDRRVPGSRSGPVPGGWRGEAAFKLGPGGKVQPARRRGLGRWDPQRCSDPRRLARRRGQDVRGKSFNGGGAGVGGALEEWTYQEVKLSVGRGLKRVDLSGGEAQCGAGPEESGPYQEVRLSVGRGLKRVDPIGR
ncbi:Thymus-specific serine protease [Myotis brandtii]|uniref:Thymus-specific serine protease n=1 Tax=Myotis brandtii TaxID=109478 RepID=S7PMC1_MYOBR|nr:Thymus-specific serine protease [Myotis brandtii]